MTLRGQTILTCIGRRCAKVSQSSSTVASLTTYKSRFLAHNDDSLWGPQGIYSCFFFHHCKEWLPLGCWIVEFTLSSQIGLIFCKMTATTYPEIVWEAAKSSAVVKKVWSHSKGRTGWKVVTSLLLVVRVPKHNRPWGHTTKNRRNRETRCRLRFSGRPMAESEANARVNEPKSGENLCRNGKPLAPGDLWQCSSTANTLTRSNGTQTLPADGIHARTDGQKGEEAACREKAAKAPPHTHTHPHTTSYPAILPPTGATAGERKSQRHSWNCDRAEEETRGNLILKKERESEGEEERRHSLVFPCQRWELGWVQAQGSRGGREGWLESTIMPWLQWAKLGKQPRRLTNAQSSPVNGFHSAHPLSLSLSLSKPPTRLSSLPPTLPLPL